MEAQPKSASRRILKSLAVSLKLFLADLKWLQLLVLEEREFSFLQEE